MSPTREQIVQMRAAAEARITEARRSMLQAATDAEAAAHRRVIEDSMETLAALHEAEAALRDDASLDPLTLAEVGLASMRATLAAGGQIRNTALYVRAGEPLVTLFFTFGLTEQVKARVSEVLGRFGRSIGADLIVLTIDAFVSRVELDPADGEPMTSHAAARDEALAAGDLRPSEDPEATDALIALGITPAGAGWQAEQLYRRLDDGTFDFDPLVRVTPSGGLTPVLIATGLRGRPGAPEPQPKRCLSSIAEVSSPPMVMALNQEMEDLLS